MRAGNIYGTTGSGGEDSVDGTVFELVAPVGQGATRRNFS
jgi:hypothetical protein